MLGSVAWPGLASRLLSRAGQGICLKKAKGGDGRFSVGFGRFEERNTLLYGVALYVWCVYKWCLLSVDVLMK